MIDLDATNVIAGASLLTTWAAGVLWTVRAIRKEIQKNAERQNQRHVQNLARFRFICVALTKLGYGNGVMPTFDDG